MNLDDAPPELYRVAWARLDRPGTRERFYRTLPRAALFMDMLRADGRECSIQRYEPARWLPLDTYREDSDVQP